MSMDKCGSINCEYLTEFGYCMLSACVNPKKRGKIFFSSKTAPIELRQKNKPRKD